MHGPVSYGSTNQSVGLALATAWGIALGFLPKDSLAFYLVLVIALLLPSNLLTLAAIGAVFHLLGWCCSSLFHKLGAILLTDSRLVPTWLWLSELPVIPWTRFNNTLVMGAMTVSLVLFWPVFLFSLRLYDRFVPRVLARLDSSPVYRWLVHHVGLEERVA